MKYNSNLKAIVLFILLITVSIIIIFQPKSDERNQTIDRKLITKTGVCPPFNLYDEEGNLIDPINNINADKPYSPKQTCGKCHDYDLITEGYHFQQGKGENLPKILSERYQWVLFPGNYGGNWCSPAPLYNYLSKKNNKSPKEMDMTSFTFISSGCGTCHPGAGSFEFDREGNRYDKHMDSVGFVAGGDNNFDGDYYKSHWNRSGVGEADCMICHLPEYKFKERNQHLLGWNFKWMATAGSGLAEVTGSVKDTIPLKVTYDLSKFDKNGKLSLHLVREPRNETCLNCHSKPQWKKRGASFTTQTDVHIAKGLKCVDCHAAGSMAVDEKIRGKEVHQFGKGDDPSGWVRNDLDNTMRECKDCHITGYLNAPIAKHDWLPKFHLEELSCQACHISSRKVKSALVQVSDVYNPGTKISPPTKYIWTFYDQDLNYWNHYGELSQFTAKDQPSDPYIPQLAKYKDKIYPVNPVHSSWPGIYDNKLKGLNQPKMKDIYDMWIAFNQNPQSYPELTKIRDDNKDSIPEINRPEEIDAFIISVKKHLDKCGYDLTGKSIVWVNNDRMYFNSKEYKLLEKNYYESSPYASVYKYNHDVSPARSALGIKGCVECHTFDKSGIFYKEVVKYPFDENGNPVYEMQYKRLNLSGFAVWLSAFREQILKEIEYPLITIMFVILLIVYLLIYKLFDKQLGLISLSNMHYVYIYLLIFVGFVALYLNSEAYSFIIPDRLWFDQNHFYVGILPVLLGLYAFLSLRKEKNGNTILAVLIKYTTIIATIFGINMIILSDSIEFAKAFIYTFFDFSIIILSALLLLFLVNEQLGLSNEKTA